jgi:hypothetical protein
MTAINIQDASGHSVSIEHEGADLSYLSTFVLMLWKQTKTRNRRKGAGPAMGFSGERRGAADIAKPLQMEEPA